MGEKLYRVIFRGEFAPGGELEAVKANLANLFATEVSKIERLFGGKPVVIKKDIDEETASKYQRALENCGAIAIVQEMPSAATAPAPQPSVDMAQMPGELSPTAVRCPKCGSVQESDDECLSCGIIISKYKAREQQQQQSEAASSEALSVVPEPGTTTVRIARSTDVEQYVSDIKEMLEDGHWQQAQENLEALLIKSPDDWELHLMMAKSHLLAGKLAVPEAATHHARRAAELGAPATPEVAEVIAEIFALDGKAGEGVVWLERAHESIESGKEKEKFAQKINEYREEAKLGDCWQLFDRRSQLIFEIADIEEIRAKLLSGDLPPDSTCRKNRVGEPKPLAEGIAKEEGRIGILFNPLAYHAKNGGIVIGVVAAAAAVAVAMFLAFTGGIGVVGEFFQETGLDWDEMNVWAKGAFVVTMIFVVFSVFRLNFGGLILVFIIGSVTTAILTQGTFSFDELQAFMMLSVLGMPLFLILASIALVVVGIVGFVAGFAAGAALGAVVGLIRLPGLPRIKVAPSGPAG